MDFKKVALDDIDILNKALSRYRGRACDISAGNLVFWRDYYDISYAAEKEGIVIRFGEMDGTESFWCKPSEPLVSRLIEDNGGSVKLSCICEREVEELAESFCVSEIEYSEDYRDYIYLAEDITALAGRRFAGQRNHINKFKKLYSGYRFDSITKDNAEAVKNFCYGYFHTFGRERAEVAEYEELHIIEQLDSIERYRQDTGVLYVGDEIVGFSIGERVGDTLIVHTEKADTRFDGAYPMLVWLFANRYAVGGIRYINREEDCGVEGLRISKTSYHPIELLKKYTLTVKQ